MMLERENVKNFFFFLSEPISNFPPFSFAVPISSREIVVEKFNFNFVFLSDFNKRCSRLYTVQILGSKAEIAKDMFFSRLADWIVIESTTKFSLKERRDLETTNNRRIKGKG